MAMEIQDYSPRFKTVCAKCGHLPAHRRLYVKRGSGRSESHYVFCAGCAIELLHVFAKSVDTAADMVCGHSDSVQRASLLEVMRHADATRRQLREARKRAEGAA